MGGLLAQAKMLDLRLAREQEKGAQLTRANMSDPGPGLEAIYIIRVFVFYLGVANSLNIPI